MDVTKRSYEEIRQELVKHIFKYRSEYPILSNNPEAIFNQQIDMLAAALTYNSFKYEKNRSETYLKTARIESSIYVRAKELSYNIYRKSCPKIKMTTMEERSFHRGEVVGVINDNGKTYNVIYFGLDRLYTVGEEIEFCVGIYREFEKEVTDTDYTKLVAFKIQPDNKEYNIDNINYMMFINEKLVVVNRIMEDYTIKSEATEITTEDGGMELWVGEHNDDVKYGIPTNPNDKIKFCYIETTGLMINLHNIVIRNEIGLSEGYQLVDPQLVFEGHNSEYVEKVARLAPLLFKTAKRAVTLRDHEIITNYFPLIKDCYAELDTSKCCTIMIYYIREGSGEQSIPLSEYEMQMYQKFFDNYGLGPDIVLYRATPVIYNWEFYLFLKDGVRPPNDASGAFEEKMKKEIEIFCQSKNLILGHIFTVGEMLAEIYKKYPIIDGYVLESNTSKEVYPSTIVDITKKQYAYVIPKVHIIANNGRGRAL